MNTFIKTIILGIALLIVGFSSYILFGIPYTYSDGDRSGVVFKISKKGFPIKTWEGEINVGTASSDVSSSIAMKVWDFSVANDGLAEKIEGFARSGERVTLHYEEPFKMGMWYGKSEYLVTNVYGATDVK